MRTLVVAAVLLACAGTAAAQTPDSASVTASWAVRSNASVYVVTWSGPGWVRGPFTVTDTSHTITVPRQDTAYHATACAEWVHRRGHVVQPHACGSALVEALADVPLDTVVVVVDTVTPEPEPEPEPEPAPPPPVGAWPNEPPGNVVVADEPFVERLLSPQPGGRWEWGNGAETTSAMSIEPTASGGTAMRWSWPEGKRGGDSPGRAVITSTAMQFHSYYVGVLVRWSVPWTAHTSGANKILYWGSMEARETLGWGPTQYYLNRRGNVIDLTLQHAQANGQSNIPASSAARVASTRVDDGQWHRIELLVDGNDAGAANCRARVWVDGVLNFDVGGLVCTNDRSRFYGINLDPIWGGIGEEKPQAEWLEMDHVRVSGR